MYSYERLVIIQVMIKRILLTVLTVMVVYSAVVIGVSLFEPEASETTLESQHAYALDYETLKDYTLNSGTSATHFFLFSSVDNSDCLYVENTVLRNAEAETGLNLSDLIEIVDITNLERTLSTNRLKTDWNILSYPAFVACHVANGLITIDNKLEWDPNQPISTNDVERWLTLNGVYEGDAIEEAIETPAG